MRFTNRANLPPHLAAILKAAWNTAQDNYLAARQIGTKVISVTELISPPQKRRLEREHAAELEMDVLDTVPSLRGSSLHHILEMAGKDAPERIPEERLSTTIDTWTITGKSDLYTTQDGKLIDFKDSSVWVYVFGKREWDAQLNVLRWIRVRNGGFVSSLEVDLFCGDWRRSEARRDPDYPPRVVVMPVKMWSLDEAEAFVMERLRLYAANVPPECSAEERWEKPTTYALMKNGAKRAAKVYRADEPVPTAPVGHSIVKRPGQSVRCLDYCMAAPWCGTWAKDPTNPKNAVTEEVAV